MSSLETAQLLFAAYLGLMTAIVFAALGVFAVARDRAYLWYAAMQVGTGVHVFVSDRAGVTLFEQLGVGLTELMRFVRPPSAALMVLGAAGFAIHFLDTKRRLPVGHRFLLAIVGYALALLVATPLGFGQTIGAALRYIGLIGPVVILSLGLLAHRRGVDGALVYVSAQGAFALGAAAQAWMAMRYGLVDSAAPMALGSIAEATLLAVTLVQRSARQRAERTALERRVERASRLSAMGQLVAGIAHEIRNPNGFVSYNLPVVEHNLQGIETALTMREEAPELRVAGRPLDEVLDETFRLIEHMKHGTRRITALVDELRAFSSAPSEGLAPISLAEVVSRALLLVRVELHRRGVKEQVTIPDALPDLIGAPGKVEQVVVNLLLNAAQACRQGEGRIRVHADASTDEVRLVVEDNGHGIAAARLGQVFDPFFTTRSEEGGTGLGLAVSRELVEAMGGRIEAQSEEGRGARFVVWLPRASEAT